MQTANINGVTLAYRDEGSGAPVLFIHAFPLDSAMWAAQIDDLAQHYRVIAPDLRGFGASGDSDGTASMDQYADDLVALLDGLGIERAVLCGVSMGGYIAFAIWRRHRARVSALILADTRAGADTNEGRQGRERNAQLVEARGMAALADQMLPKLLANNAISALHAQVRTIITRLAPAGVVAALRAMAARPDSTPLLATIDVPTLVIVGSEDLLTPPAEARTLHRAIKHSRLVELPGVAHLANIEAPAAFNSAVHGFLSDALAFTAGGGSEGGW